MTLSTFLRDYLYIPLGGNQHGKFKRYRNLLLTMLLGGLWHGAGWNFTDVTGMLFSPVTGSSNIPVYTLEYYGGFPNNTIGSSAEMGGVSLARQVERGGFDFSLYGNQTPSGGTNTASVRQWQPENNVNDNLGETGNYYGGGGFFSSSRAAVISENPYLYGIGDSGGDTQEGNSNSIQGTSAGSAVDTFGIGGRADSSETYFDNVVVEARLALNVIPINQRKHNALNYNDPATFWTQSTPDDPSGGGGGIALIPVIMNHLRNQGIA
jgi:hypothetical protein